MTAENAHTISTALDDAASTPRLLIACDFDGTIAALADRPELATLDPGAAAALRQLSELPNTEVAIISGRGLHDLARRFAGIPRAHLVGSHGGEFEHLPATPLTSEQLAVLARAKEIALDLTRRFPGTRVEEKPIAVAFHFRGLTQDMEETALVAAQSAFSELQGGFTRLGSKVVELCATRADKGQALGHLRYQITPSLTVFIGDDVTDEDIFRVLSSHDLGVKIGPEDSAARFRVSHMSEAIQLVASLAEKRSVLFQSGPSTPIDRHSLLSDLRTFALLDDRGTIVWFCAPALDSAPLFGSLVGGPGAGSFSVSARGALSQNYFDDTCVCTTHFGKTSVTDFLDCSSGRSFQRAGRSDLIRMFSGPGPVEVTFAPKIDFGRMRTKLVPLEGGLKVEGGTLPMVLRSPGWQWHIFREGGHDVAKAFHDHPDGQVLELSLGTGAFHHAHTDNLQRRRDTERFWHAWAASLKIPTVASKEVVRSALTLRALTYGPTGAIAAAATTSLPESLGGVRNWDYRFCWPRDASMAAHALARLGAPGPGMRLLDWILGTLDSCEEGEFLRPVYTVTGRHVFGEAEVAEAIGYRGSRPVRVGNLATQQLQLDSLGPVANLLAELARQGCPLSADHLSIADRMVSLILNRWRDPDHGIWEIRSEQRHYVHSKLMCWQTVSQGIEVAAYLGIERPEWTVLRDAIRNDIETNGFDSEVGSYKAAYDLNAPDAALSWVVLSGFHPPDHPRSKGTIDYIMKHLLREGSVYRYLFNDALSGHEGTFHICTAWLIEALILMGMRAQAEDLFTVLLSRIGPTGLMSEQWDTEQNIALGNFPQAYSHLGLINSAWALGR